MENQENREENAQNGNKCKRRRKCLTISEKLNILKRLDDGEKQCDVAADLGIPATTISGIKQNRGEIMRHEEALKTEQGSLVKKRYSGQEEACLDKIVFSWFVEKRAEGSPITSSCVQECARLINEKLGGSSDFKASNGWLYKFNRRHGIRQSSMQREKLSANHQASDDFCQEIREFIEEEGYLHDNVYNADESGLQWKGLPDKSLAARNEQRAWGRKSAQDRITIMVCANSTGTHRLPLLAIGKAKQPRCFLNVDVLPLVYMNQKSAWMDRNLFMQWYSEVFVPDVRAKQTNDNFKILLILDNAPSHPPEAELNLIDQNFQVKYLPPNVTSLIQPMGQGVIISLKRLYKRSFLREFLLSDIEADKKVEEFLKSWSLVRCFEKLAAAWECVPEATLKNSWNNLFRNNVVVEWVNDVHMSEIGRLATRATKETFNEDEIETWLNVDKYDSGWKIRTVDEIIQSIMHPDEMNDEMQNEDDEDDANVDSTSDQDNRVTCREALDSARKLYNWYGSRRDSNPDFLRQLACVNDFISSVTVKQEYEH